MKLNKNEMVAKTGRPEVSAKADGTWCSEVAIGRVMPLKLIWPEVMMPDDDYLPFAPGEPRTIVDETLNTVLGLPSRSLLIVATGRIRRIGWRRLAADFVLTPAEEAEVLMAVTYWKNDDRPIISGEEPVFDDDDLHVDFYHRSLPGCVDGCGIDVWCLRRSEKLEHLFNGIEVSDKSRIRAGEEYRRSYLRKRPKYRRKIEQKLQPLADVRTDVSLVFYDMFWGIKWAQTAQYESSIVIRPYSAEGLREGQMSLQISPSRQSAAVAKQRLKACLADE